MKSERKRGFVQQQDRVETAVSLSDSLTSVFTNIDLHYLAARFHFH